MLTLKTFSKADPSVIFEQIALHMMKQQERSNIPGTNFRALHGEHGLKSAAGCLIADDEYSPEMEGYTWTKMVEMDLVPIRCRTMIANLETIHSQRPVNEWQKHLTDTAKAYDFTNSFLLRPVTDNRRLAG